MRKSRLLTQEANVQECQDMGITGASIQQELRGLTKGLPAVFHQAAQHLQHDSIGEAASHYAAFSSATLSATVAAQSAAELLPALHRVREAHSAAEAEAGDQGDSTVSEQTGGVPAADAGGDLTDTAHSKASAAERAKLPGLQHAILFHADFSASEKHVSTPSAP